MFWTEVGIAGTESAAASEAALSPAHLGLVFSVVACVLACIKLSAQFSCLTGWI